MKKQKAIRRLLLMCFGLSSPLAFGQAITNDYRVVSSAVPFMTISPDSKAAAMGDAGVASRPDVNSIYWNTAKLAFIEEGSGVNFSYAPWLRDLVGDMGLLNLSTYKKINDRSALTAEFTYFNQGKIEFTTNTGASAGDFQSREFTITGGYAMKLSQDFSAGINVKFINSNLIGTQAINQQVSKPARTVAGDLGFYYHKDRPTDDMKKTNWAFGLMLKNIGGKVNYGQDVEYFLPMQLKVGTGFTVNADEKSQFNFLLDFNKLLVPTPQEDNTLPEYGTVQSIFKSFGDAPGGFNEELKEFTTSFGAEYIYDKLLAFRTGYFFEPASKGGRKYLTVGAGLRLKQSLGLDLAYLIPTNQGNPLANTWRITLNYNIPSKGLNQTNINNL
ncbi:type IX secretion system outer membrane channel protein PorV [Marinilongibacter aquaticus]|uniref:type IX secretion system outer membrane channel protein PorV n=1 Tax=Marinilongibacter aquaticus TaxID=2975157 RepID=UPI0021BDB1ED|nr:type IX secretion system outer membrane channel protein PorV [Marinilongibacter aquaticus]UBM57919.1 type IX secretion system outer membrane channel protein PorV [Marinilongibacter aquaticus]